MSKRVFLKATRDVAAGEELLVCYGAGYQRASYTSSCADEARSDEWTRRDYARIRPLITRRQSPGIA